MMQPVLAIYKKDLKAFLTNPMFYTLLGFCCCLWSFVFAFQVYAFIQKSYQVSLQSQNVVLNIYQDLVTSYLVVVHYVLIFILAALSIRFFAEEKKLKTFPILLYHPLTSWQIVLGKWLVGLTVIYILLLVSAILPLSLLFFVEIPFRLLLLGYFGTALMLSVYMTVGLLVSSTTESLIICVVVTLVFSILLLTLGLGKDLASSSFLQSVFQFLSFEGHFANFRKGILSLSSVLYLNSWSLILALITERVIEFHRWR
jgi:ABC-2 type transport system permease protein